MFGRRKLPDAVAGLIKLTSIEDDRVIRDVWVRADSIETVESVERDGRLQTFVIGLAGVSSVIDTPEQIIRMIIDAKPKR